MDVGICGNIFLGANPAGNRGGIKTIKNFSKDTKTKGKSDTLVQYQHVQQ
jgi:hypothetical protein